MRIKEVMSHPVVSCRTDMTLDAVVRLMSEYNCGIVPVVDADGRLTGVLTDRDICLAALKRNQALNMIPVGEVMARQVFSCRADDLVESAERLMREQRIHRVTAIDADRRPVGVLSVDDLAQMAAKSKKSGVEREFIQTLADICRPAVHAPRTTKAGTVVI
jgi:CBS domain-containing protein